MLRAVLESQLVAVGMLLWLGYIGARVVERFRLPYVTGFLLVGIVLGPYALRVFDAARLAKLQLAEPLALGVIMFFIGKRLTPRRLLRRHRPYWLVTGLEMLLPALVVGGAVWALFPAQPAYALVLAACAISGAPATVESVINAAGAKGSISDTVVDAAALDCVVAVVVFSAFLPSLTGAAGRIASPGSALVATLTQVGGALVLGTALGLVLALLLEHAQDEGEILALALIHALLAVGLAEALGFSDIIAPLAVGVAVSIIEEQRGEGFGVFRIVRANEFPVYVIFFTLAGASLRFTSLAASGVLVAVYVVGRAAAKWASGVLGRPKGLTFAQASWLGLGLTPQAGVAIALGLTTARLLPGAGTTINAVVLTSVAIFEILGPIATRRAVTAERGKAA